MHKRCAGLDLIDACFCGLLKPRQTAPYPANSHAGPTSYHFLIGAHASARSEPFHHVKWDMGHECRHSVRCIAVACSTATGVK
jgi:hypothetical protein